MTKLEYMFLSKKKLLERIIILEKDVAKLQHICKEKEQVCNNLSNDVAVLQNQVKGLTDNYAEVVKNINSIFGIEDLDPQKINKAKIENQNYYEAISEVFDWR